MGLIRAILAGDGWAVRWELSRTYRRNYFDRVEVMDSSIHEELRGEAKVIGALYCKRLRAKKVIVSKGEYYGNGRTYRMFLPDCGNITWNCFLNGPERRTIKDAEQIANGLVWENIGGESNESTV